MVILLPWIKLWWKLISSKIAAFSWKVIHGKLLTKDKFIEERSFDWHERLHLLITCPVALLVWNSIFTWLGNSLSFSASFREHYLKFTLSEKSKSRRKVADLIWQYTMWKPWKILNGLIFKDISFTLDELIYDIKFCS